MIQVFAMAAAADAGLEEGSKGPLLWASCPRPTIFRKAMRRPAVEARLLLPRFPRKKVHLRKMETKERVKEKGILLGRARSLLLLHFLTLAVYFCLLL